VRRVRRRYREGTLVLETDLETEDGEVRLIDFMPVRDHAPDLVRIVEGRRGRVPMRLDLVIRFDNGRLLPWVRQREGALTAVAGPNAMCLRGDIPMRGEDLATVGDFTVGPGERRAMVATWFQSHDPLPPPIDPEAALRDTESWWREWSGRCTYGGPWREAVLTSLMVLKALTFAPTGGMVAAPTTSLPEWPGGVRNWDYRYCWLRDATMTLYALMLTGYTEEAAAWREWLLRAAAGDPARLQIMYGVSGERRLAEYEADWLPGYEGSAPVRIGNQAHEQLQLDVYGELADALFQARRFGIGADPWAWDFEVALLDSLESRWAQPDEGIWEVRGPRRHFTHSKVMSWVAFDRAIKSVECFCLQAPNSEAETATAELVARWRAARDRIHAEVCARAYDPARKAFTQSYGSSRMDASLLLMPMVGFLPPRDPRIVGTIAGIERELLRDGFVHRYLTEPGGDVDGLPAGEGVFLPCTFWLVDAYVQLGRMDEARAIFERLLAVRNDLGLLSEEYDPAGKRLLGNFPQALTHLALVGSAHNLAGHAKGPAKSRGDGTKSSTA
jgi:GH15 family glucan-1,4-alpha-glucosidase